MTFIRTLSTTTLRCSLIMGKFDMRQNSELVLTLIIYTNHSSRGTHYTMVPYSCGLRNQVNKNSCDWFINEDNLIRNSKCNSVDSDDRIITNTAAIVIILRQPLPNLIALFSHCNIIPCYAIFTYSDMHRADGAKGSRSSEPRLQ